MSIIEEATWEVRGGPAQIPKLPAHELMGAAQPCLPRAHRAKKTIVVRGLEAEPGLEVACDSGHRHSRHCTHRTVKIPAALYRLFLESTSVCFQVPLEARAHQTTQRFPMDSTDITCILSTKALHAVCIQEELAPAGQHQRSTVGMKNRPDQQAHGGTFGHEISEGAFFDFCSFVLKGKLPPQKRSLPQHKE